MKKIWKYSVPVEDSFTIILPSGARILTIQRQAGVARMWVLLDESNPPVVRRFKTFGTGHSIDTENLTYVGTYQDMQFVWHVFEEVQE